MRILLIRGNSAPHGHYLLLNSDPYPRGHPCRIISASRSGTCGKRPRSEPGWGEASQLRSLTQFDESGGDQRGLITDLTTQWTPHRLPSYRENGMRISFLCVRHFLFQKLVLFFFIQPKFVISFLENCVRHATSQLRVSEFRFRFWKLKWLGWSPIGAYIVNATWL